MAAAGEVLAPGDPRLVGGYTVLRRLGQGGMGVVYLASAADGAVVALKVIHRALADDEEFRRRFRREVAAARRVARFCTAPVLDADVDAGAALRRGQGGPVRGDDGPLRRTGSRVVGGAVRARAGVTRSAAGVTPLARSTTPRTSRP